MAKEIRGLDDVETGDKIKSGMVEYEVLEVVEGGGLGGPRPHIKVQALNGDDEADGWPDEGEEKEIKEANFHANMERSDE